MKNESSSLIRHVLWRGIYMPGHEACWLWWLGENWQLEGTAVFAHKQKPCQLSYRIACDQSWQTQSAEVQGWAGDERIDIHIRVNSEKRWWLNEKEVPGAAGSIDLDLNFSPCTNLLPIRRLGLEIGEAADISPAWLRFPSFTLEPLAQRYQRTGKLSYRYESGVGRFMAELQVDPQGFVVDYPGFGSRRPAFNRFDHDNYSPGQ